jgi:hypothetical protein
MTVEDELRTTREGQTLSDHLKLLVGTQLWLVAKMPIQRKPNGLLVKLSLEMQTPIDSYIAG